MSELDREEREILEAYREGKLEPVVLSAEEIQRYRNAARAVSRKDKRVNIRMSSVDLRDLQIRAMQEGVPDSKGDLEERESAMTSRRHPLRRRASLPLRDREAVP